MHPTTPRTAASGVRIVVALGGNALLRRGQPMTAGHQRDNIRLAATHLAPIAAGNELVISHGNGPQVGLLSLQAAAYEGVEPYPLDVLGAETEGMIGYLIEQELGNLLPFDRPFASLLTMVEVDPDDPAFDDPTKFIGPVYTQAEAEGIAAAKGWTVKRDGEWWRRVVASPAPVRIFEIRPIRWLLERGCVVICAGGGGIPTAYRPGTRTLAGAEVVIDKDRASALLAVELDADLFVMATDVDAVYARWGHPDEAPIRHATAAELEALPLPAGSMGPKAEAAATFVRRTGRRAAIGTLAELGGLVTGTHGTQVEGDCGRGTQRGAEAGLAR
jgi:carbamate kinase